MYGKVVTAHNSVLTINRKFALAHRPRGVVKNWKMIRGFHAHEHGILILISPKEVPFSIPGTQTRARIHVLESVSLGTDEFAMISQASRRYISARPVASKRGELVQRDAINAWELFSIEGDVTPPAAIDSIVKMATHPRLSCADVLQVIDSAQEDDDGLIIEATLPLLDADQWSLLGDTLIADPRLLAQLQRLLPEDVFSAYGMTALVDSLSGAVDGRRRTVGPEFDSLSLLGKIDSFGSVAHSALCSTRAASLPSRGPCIVATARNEGVYLLEWIAYHRALGFEEIFLYSNNNDDLSDELLGALADAGEIVWLNNIMGEARDAQAKSYAHALSILPDILSHEWALFIDLDEYLWIDRNRFTGLDDFLRWHRRVELDAIALNWVYFGSSSQTKWSNAPLSCRFQRRTPDPDPHIKSMIRPQRFISSQPHFPFAGEKFTVRTRAASGEPYRYKESHLKPAVQPALSFSPSDTHAFVAHYFYKSCEELLWKFSRNRGNQSVISDDVAVTLEPRFLRGFLQQFDSDSGLSEDLWSANPDAQGMLDKLYSIESINLASEKVRAAFRSRLDLVVDAYHAPLSQNFGPDGIAFLELLNR